MKNNLLSATIIGGILLFSASLGHANDPKVEAVAIAKSLSATDGSGSATSDHAEIGLKTETHRLLTDRLLERNDLDIEPLLAKAEAVGVENLDIHKAFATINILSPDDDAVIARNLAFMESQLTSGDWKRQHLVYLYLGNHHVFSQSNVVALDYAQKALEVVPSTLSGNDADDARYETYDLLHTAFIIDRNASKAIDATQKLVEYGRDMGRNIDEVAIIHNLAVLFSRARNFDTASELSAILITMQDDKTEWQQAVANYGHGANLSEAGKFSEAVPFLEKGIKFATGTRLEDAANIRLSLAYAKTGQIRKAQKLLNQFDKLDKSGDQTWQEMNRYVTQAKAEVAYANGHYREGYTFLQDWAENRTQNLESLLFEDRRRASEGLALSERVAQERQERLQYEVIASKEIAKRGNILALFAALLAFALGFIAFNLNRQRKRQALINAELASARDRALAGEETKSKFISMMGHELRTPMNPIISLADILHTRARDEDTKQMLRMISASGRTMLSMVENILIVADETKRKLTVSPQKTKIRDFIRFTSTGFQQDAEDKGLKFAVNVDENVPQYMNIDKLKLRTIFTNMLSNAVKFTSQGSVYASIMMVENPHLGVCMLISVKDTGSGMTQDQVNALRAVFKQQDQSHTTTNDGVGVGLYVTELYTKAHGGRMAISSHPKDGTRLDVYIPYAMSAPKVLAA